MLVETFCSLLDEGSDLSSAFQQLMNMLIFLGNSYTFSFYLHAKHIEIHYYDMRRYSLLG